MSRKLKRRKPKNNFFNSIDHLEEELNQPIIGLRVLVGILIIAFLLIGSVWQKVNVTQLAQDIQQLEKEKKLIEEKNTELESKILKLADRKKVIKIAEERLNMIFPDCELVPLEQKYHQSNFNE